MVDRAVPSSAELAAAKRNALPGDDFANDWRREIWARLEVEVAVSRKLGVVDK